MTYEVCAYNRVGRLLQMDTRPDRASASLEAIEKLRYGADTVSVYFRGKVLKAWNRRSKAEVCGWCGGRPRKGKPSCAACAKWEDR